MKVKRVTNADDSARPERGKPEGKKARVAKKRLICPRMLMIVKNIPAPGTAAQINYTSSPFRKKRKEALNA
ncbi:hypothetical protein [Kosakonia sacchari]|uniref:hypothetical protein n=1 Tax=Kosakonia sacchari TaxID=1158459 RepID=UPI0003A855DA|nr:hypothetical protein [Kosakonia sacchari]